jgi:hypothetical protein
MNYKTEDSEGSLHRIDKSVSPSSSLSYASLEEKKQTINKRHSSLGKDVTDYHKKAKLNNNIIRKEVKSWRNVADLICNEDSSQVYKFILLQLNQYKKKILRKKKKRRAVHDSININTK